MKISLAPQGHYTYVSKAFDAFPDMPRTHVLGHHHLTGVWHHPTKYRGDYAPDWFSKKKNPSHWVNRKKWKLHTKELTAYFERWKREVGHNPGERITLNPEHFPALYNPTSDRGVYGRSENTHHAYLEAIVDRTIDVLDEAIEPLAAFIGISGPWLVKHWHDLEDFERRCSRSTMGLDYRSPQSYIQPTPDWRATNDQLRVARHLPIIPIITPNYGIGGYPILSRIISVDDMKRHRDMLEDHGVEEVDVWMHMAVTTTEQCEVRIETYKPAIERVMEVYGEEGGQDITKCPNCGGPADNGFSREIPPNPYWCTKCEQEIDDE